MKQNTDSSSFSRLPDASGYDPIEDRLRANVRATIEAMFEEELADFLGRLRYDRGNEWAEGDRQLTGTFGTKTVRVPRARIESEVGKMTEWRSKTLPRYRRLTKKAEALIAAVYLAGTNTRRVKRALFGLFEGAVSKDVVSRAWRKVKVDRDAWRARDLAGEDIEREVRKSGGPRRRRGPKRDKDRVTREEVLSVNVPSGSRFKGYRTILVRNLSISADLVRYRRERWLTPEGKTIIAPLPEGLLGGFGANLRRFCLALHAQGQVTMEQLTAILNGIGLDISKRQVVRILTSDLDGLWRRIRRSFRKNDLRACVTKRRISGGTMSADGRQARDMMLGLMKTCRKLGISFFAYLGDRLGVKGLTGCIPFHPELVAVRPA